MIWDQQLYYIYRIFKYHQILSCILSFFIIFTLNAFLIITDCFCNNYGYNWVYIAAHCIKFWDRFMSLFFQGVMWKLYCFNCKNMSFNLRQLPLKGFLCNRKVLLFLKSVNTLKYLHYLFVMHVEDSHIYINVIIQLSDNHL